MLYYDDSLTVHYPSDNSYNPELGKWQHEINNFDAISLNRQDCEFGVGGKRVAQLAANTTKTLL